MADPVRLSGPRNGDIRQALEIGADAFAIDISRAHAKSILRGYDRRITRVLRRDNEILGAYFIRKGQIPGSHHAVMRRTGLQGVGLCLRADMRGQGYGRFLRGVLPQMGIDMGLDLVWGVANKNLGNRGDWEKQRAIVQEDETAFLSVHPLASDLKVKLEEFATPEARRRWGVRAWKSTDREIDARVILEEKQTQDGIRLQPWFMTADDVFPVKCGGDVHAQLIEREGDTVRAVIRNGDITRGQGAVIAVPELVLEPEFAPGV